MRRLTDEERGSAVILVAIVGVVLFAMSAFVIDVGALVQERRVLQNGADASALAIAEQCGGDDCGDPSATAEQYADGNADDGVSTIEELCGSGVTGVDECSDPPDVPDGAGYVRVTTKTARTDGSDEVPFSFARFLGHDGQSVHMRATAAWGGPSGLTAELPMTISACEFEAYTDGGEDLEEAPPYGASGFPSPEVTIYMHNTAEASPCEAGPSGADLPGGFGWLDTGEADCRATSDTEGWFDDKTGRPPPSSCTPALMDALVGTVVHLPVFDQTNGLSGTNGEYHMAFYASFYITGYFIQGQFKEASLVTGAFPCGGSASCVSGFFVQDTAPVSGTIGGPSMGVFVVQLIG